MADQVRYSIEKLNSDNYSTWCYKMKLLLMKDDLWSVINELQPVPVDSAWTKKDESAQIAIGLLVEDNQLRHIKDKNSARDQWEALKKYHQKASLSNKLCLYKRIFRTVLEEDGDMEQHVTLLLEYVDKLAGLGQILSDDIIASVLLGSLPESYDTLVTALESRPESDLTSDFVKGKLIDEYKRRKSTQELRKHASDEVVMKTVYKNEKENYSKNLTCNYCKKRGHIKSECYKLKARIEKQEQANATVDEKLESCLLTKVETCLETTEKPDDKTWVIDSGATSHMAQTKDYFTNLDINKNGYVRLADNKNKVQIEGVGSITITCAVENKISKIQINNALYTPGLGSNLLSVKKLTKDGYKIIFEDDNCKIIKNEKIEALASSHSDLYVLNQSEKIFLSKEIKEKSCNDCVHIWHRRFGHRDIKTVKDLIGKELVTGLQIKTCNNDNICESCIQGKMSRIPFPIESKSNTTMPLELLHSDVCGPMQTITPSNKRYILTIIDDYSKFTHIFLMSHKNEAASCIKNFIEMIKTQWNKTPKAIRSDRGREYVNEELQNYLKQQGIKIQYTAPYSPQQNGVSERKNRSLIEMTRCMLIDANLDKKYWAEAVNYANYLQNRLPTKGSDKTPFELWYSKRPNVKDIHIFGCTAYIHIPKEQRKKLDLKAEKLHFVGYSELSKAFRLLDIKTNKIRISRDVIFIEKTVESDKKEFEVISNELKYHEETKNSEMDKNCLTDENSSSSISRNSQSDQDSDYEDAHYEDASNSDTEPRRSQRLNRGVPPNRYTALANLAINELDPRNVREALSRSDSFHWKCAMDEEIKSLNENNTWEIVPRPVDKNIISCKWVFKTKRNFKGEIERYKARLVARGFSQKYGTDYDQIFAPVVKQTTFRTLLTIAGQNNMDIRHFDAKTAFLNADLDEDIYMQLPETYNTLDNRTELVCRLRKSIYGLKQAAKTWNDCLNNCLKECEFVQSKADPCLYTKAFGNKYIYLIVYVDDFLIAASEEEKIINVANFLNKKFKLKDLGNLKYYLGIEVDKNSNNIYTIKQSQYIQKILSDFGLQDAKISSVPLDQGYLKYREESVPMNNNEKYQQLIGSLLYLSVNTRPDISASVSILSQHNKNPSSTDWNEVKRIARYLKGTIDYKLVLGKNNTSSKLIGYADADWAENREDRKSNSGYVFQYYDSPISWSCRKQTCVALSSTEAEYISLAEATQEAIWIKRLLEDFKERILDTTLIYEDNQSCLKLIDSRKINGRSKHIDTKFHFIKDLKDQKLINYEYCPTENMIADMLTKPLGKMKLKYLANKCGLNTESSPKEE